MNYVKQTGKRVFTSNDVAVDVFTLKKLEHAGLLESCGERDTESNQTYFSLPPTAVLTQESRYGGELARIMAWSIAHRKYTFLGQDVKIHHAVLNSMADGGLLEKTGRQYRVYWRSLTYRWQKRSKND